VRAALPETGPLVIVAHSLGSVVAMDLLARLPERVEVDLLVTAGSPLGLDAVRTSLWARGVNRPHRTGRWVNTYYAGDPVAIGCPLAGRWPGVNDEFRVHNPRDRAHDIAEYLGHEVVARAVGERLR